MRALLDINVLIALDDRDHVQHQHAALWFESNATLCHALWGDDISLLYPAYFHHPHVDSHNQLKDLYLLALAVKNGGRLGSFDQCIPLSAVRGAVAEHLVRL